MGFFFDLLQRPEAVPAILAVFGVIFGILKRLAFVKEWKLGVAINAVEVGVDTTYQNYVKNVKIANVDGKLTESEKQRAREMAFQVAREYASAEGLNLLKYYGKEYLPIIIEKIVARNKTIGLLAKTGLRPFLEPPELSV